MYELWRWTSLGVYSLFVANVALLQLLWSIKYTLVSFTDDWNMLRTQYIEELFTTKTCGGNLIN